MDQLGQDDPKSLSRLIWAMAIMALVFVGTSWWMKSTAPKTPPAAEKPATSQGSAPAKAADEPLASVQPVPAETETQPLAAAQEATSVLENDDLHLEFSNKGGVLTKAVLKNYRGKNGSNSDLVSPLSHLMGRYPFAVLTGDSAYDAAVSAALFHVEQSAGEAGARALTLSWADGKGNAVTKTFTLTPTGYELTLQVAGVQGGKAMAGVPLTWGPGFGQLTPSQAKDKYYTPDYVGLMEGEKFVELKPGKLKDGQSQITDNWGQRGPIAWAGIADNYFAAIFLPGSPIPGATTTTRGLTLEEQKDYAATAAIQLTVTFPEKGRVFVGPKEWKRLSSLGPGVEKMQGWGMLAPICAFLLWSLKSIYALVANYGVAIILLTFFIKVAFYPLTQRSMVKMKELGEGMKKLKPQVDRIKAKYKKMPKDMAARSKMNEEMMALYQREGINPLGGMSGCLPLLLQMPVFFALFRLLPHTIELRGAPFFGWIQDLSVQDPYYITPIVMGVTMFISTKMTSSTGMEGSQKMMLYFMPILFTGMCLFAPAGLTLYWLVNNLLTMGQQALINRQVAKRQEEAAKNRKSTPKGPSRPSS